MTRFGCSTWRAVLLCGAAFSATRCVVPHVELEGKSCVSAPCHSDYVCVDGVCLRPEHVPDAGSTTLCTIPDTQPCGVTRGECHEGTETCQSDGTWGACEGEVKATAEICDKLDNDCNGKTDDGLVGTPCELTKGVCAYSTRSCVAGEWEKTCGAADYGLDYEAVETRCDGVDNDCDGKTDEDLVGTACELTKGVCAGSTRRCVTGQWETSCDATDYGANYELTEKTCDGLDNDCDGTTDKGLLGTACELQTGVCAGAKRACVAGAFETPCTGLSYGSDYRANEVCDGLDNNCNGTTDEGFTCALGSTGSSCTTSCSSIGQQVCNATCTGYTCAPPPEACNGVDDDCDGAAPPQNIDNGLNSGFLQLAPLNTAQSPVAHAFGATGGGFLVAYTPSSGTGSLIVQPVLPTQGNPTAGTPIAVMGSSHPVSPALATAHVGWIESGTVKAATIDASSGSPGSGFTVTSNAASSLVAEDATYQTLPASLLAWGSGTGLKYAWLRGTSTAGNGSIDPVSPTTYANPTLGHVGSTAVLAWEAFSTASQIVRSVAMKDSVGTLTDLTSTTITALQPALSTDAIAYVVPGSCTSPNCPPGHSTSSKIVLGHLTLATGDVPTLGPTKDLTDPKTVYAEQPRVATIGGGIYIVLWQQIDGSGLAAILGATRVSWNTTGSWNAAPAMGLSQNPAFFVNYAVASDGLRFGVVMDTLNGASWNVLYRSTCP